MRTQYVLAAMLVVIWCEDLPAQMFKPFQQARPGSFLQNNTGLSGDRRFLRSNRGRGDFVGGGVDASQGFVGNTQARVEGRVPTAAATLVEEPVIIVNTPRPPAPRTGLYEPRLTIAFETVPRANEEVLDRQIQARVAKSLRVSDPAAFEVAMSGRTAILRGAVDSVAKKELAELVVQLEPAVESVRNELEVRPSTGPQPVLRRP